MDFNVLVLGSGAATPTFARHCSAQMVNICGAHILLDCGEATQTQLRQYHQKIQSIKTIFISHLHGDHFFGLPGLLSTMHLCGRKEPLTVYAPKGAREAIELLFEVSATHIDYELTMKDIDIEVPTVIHVDKGFGVTAFPLRHSTPTYGFIFEEDVPLLNLRPKVRDRYDMTNDDCIRVKQGADLALADGTVVKNTDLTLPRRLPRRYAYCCDTAFDESLIPIVEGVDLLCMESTFDSAFEAMAEERCHCTAAQAATIAARAGVGQLLLTHFSARYREIENLLGEAQSVFPNTICAADGGKYDIFYRLEKGQS